MQSTILFAFLLEMISAKPCTVRRNGNVYPLNGLATIEEINAVNEVSYIEGTEVWNTLRYAQTGNFPLTTSFTDRYNNEWQVSLNNENSQVTMCIPSGSDIYWHGDEDDHQGFDAQTEWVQLTFSYVGGCSFPLLIFHGIRVEAKGYSINSIQENKIDEERWTTVLDDVEKGVDILKALAEIAAEMAGPEEGAAEEAAEETAALNALESNGGGNSAVEAAERIRRQRA